MQWRQGDVLIERIEEFESDKVPTQDRLLVRGEGRYHGHFIEGDVEIYSLSSFDVNQNTSHYLEIREEAVLQHLHTETKKPTGEHGDLKLKPGKYRVVRQREYNPYLKTISILRD
jgi:hypothetical protein